MGQVGKIIAQLSQGKVDMDGYGSHRATTTTTTSLNFRFLGGWGSLLCVCTRQHLIIGEMSCLYV